MEKILNLEDLVSGVHLGHYVITERLAQGGMGTVFKAMEPALERHVAIKVLRPEYASNPDYVQYFQEEARAVAALRHPNIVPIYYIGVEGNVAFFSMAFIEGHTFDDWIERKRWFKIDDAKWFMRQAVAALSAAQSANIVHLDIKPANFMIDQQRTVMLTDFGLAQKIVKGDEESEREAFGTPAYVAPEQIAREKTDQRTDIYSLGATLYHLMVGRPPFDGATVEEIVWGHLEKPFPFEAAREAGLPSGWIYLIKKMMERDPEDRFENYRDLKDALNNVSSFHYETSKIELQPIKKARPVSVPRNDYDQAGLHGWLGGKGDAQWKVNQSKNSGSAVVQLDRAKVMDAFRNRLEPIKIDKMMNTVRDLCSPRADHEDDLTLAMEQVPGLDNAMRLLANFMYPQEPYYNEEGLEAPRPAYEILDVLGLERARNLALTFFSLNFELLPHPNFNFIPFWRHSLAVALVIDFMYDALEIRRSGLEYAAGLFHDLGKLLLADLFPYVYFTAVSRSMVEELPLIQCERELLGGMDHAEMISIWLKENEISNSLANIVVEHEFPDEISRRSVLSQALVSANHLVKEIGIGFSGSVYMDPLTWAEMPCTRIVWENRRNRDYTYEAFTEDFIQQFQNFPDLI